MDPLLERDRELAAVDAALAGGGVLCVVGGAGIGKTSVLDFAARRAQGSGWAALRARGSELETAFPFGVVRQLFERRVSSMPPEDRARLLAGPAASAASVVVGNVAGASGGDVSFAVMHGLYWLVANMAALAPVALVVDDAHWADESSLRWLAYLAPRVGGLPVALVTAWRGGEPGSEPESLSAIRAEAAVLRPALLSATAVAELVRGVLGRDASGALCDAIHRASGGNPFYVRELLRAFELSGRPVTELQAGDIPSIKADEITRRVLARVRGLDSTALPFAQALAVLGDGCDLRDAAAVARIGLADARRLAAELARAEVLARDDPPSFIHPVVRSSVESSLSGDARDALHRSAADVLHARGAAPGEVAVHLVRVRPAGDDWAVARLREAAADAMASGAPKGAAELLARALSERPSVGERVDVLRELALAEEHMGRRSAPARLEEALELADARPQRAEIALQLAQAHANLFRAADAVDVLERAIAELDEDDNALLARLEAELVVTGLQDARTAPRALPVVTRLATREAAGAAMEAVAVAQGMAVAFAGHPAAGAAVPLARALAGCEPRAENWDTRAALLFALLTGERFELVEAALPAMLEEARAAGSARGLIATYSALGFLKLRLGALSEADPALRAAFEVLREGDFGVGLAVVAILADVSVEAGDLDEAEALLALDGDENWPANTVTVLVPAARGRLRLAQGRAVDALAEFERCLQMVDPLMGPVGAAYVHARSGAALALLAVGEPDRARELANAELAQARTFAAPRCLGVASRVAGLTRGWNDGLELLQQSVTALRRSPAVLERARSLVAFGEALRRAGERRAAREPLAEALELATRCGAQPLAVRAREELVTAGARPRREWRTGVEALTPTELRVVRLAAAGRSNREIAHELYVTLKTVEGHLSRAYAKLGIEGRSGLSRALGGEKTRVGTL
jgi:DNA-binding CsgD family transcriptional regulator